MSRADGRRDNVVHLKFFIGKVKNDFVVFTQGINSPHNAVETWIRMPLAGLCLSTVELTSRIRGVLPTMS